MSRWHVAYADLPNQVGVVWHAWPETQGRSNHSGVCLRAAPTLARVKQLMSRMDSSGVTYLRDDSLLRSSTSDVSACTPSGMEAEPEMEAALEMEGPWKNPDQDVPFPDGIKFRMKCKNSDDTDTPFYLHGLLHLKKYKSDQYIPVVPIQSLHLWAPVEYTQANPDWMERKLCTEPEQSSDKSATGAGAKPTLKKVTLEEAKSIFQRMNNARTSKSTIWEENWDLWKQTLPLTPVERLVKNGVGNNPKRVMELLLPTQTPDSNNMNLQYVENNQFISKTVQWRKITTSDGGSFSEQIKRSGEKVFLLKLSMQLTRTGQDLTFVLMRKMKSMCSKTRMLERA